MHELGLAFDLAVNDESQLDDLGTVWENTFGGVWGGHFRDRIHFEAGGDLSDYLPVAVANDATQAAPVAGTSQVPSYITAGTNLLSAVPVVGAPAVQLAEWVGLDPASIYRDFQKWGWFGL